MNKMVLSISFVLTLALGAMMWPYTATVQQQTGAVKASGDLQSVFAQITPRTDLYRIPTPDDLDQFRQAAAAVLRDDLDRAATYLPESYKAVAFTDTPTGKLYHLLIEASVDSDGDITPGAVYGWGTYFFNPQALRELAIEAPHPRDDLFTETEGFEAFTQLDARAFLLAGARRCASNEPTSCSPPGFTCAGLNTTSVSDAAHGGFSDGRTNAFQVVHEEIFGAISNTITIQLHGNAQCSMLHAFLSNSGSASSVLPDGNVARLAEQLASSGDLTVKTCGQAGAGCTLCGKTSMQGRWTNGSRTNPCADSSAVPEKEQFIHIEQNLAMRQQAANRQQLIDAIAATEFIQ